MHNILVRSPLFKGLSLEETKELIESVPYQIKMYEPDELIVQGGETCLKLHIVIEGSVRGEMIDYSGRLLKIEDIAAPRALAVAFLFGRNNRYPVTITTNEATHMLVLPRTSVMKLMQQNEVFLTNFIDAVSSRAQFISDKLRFLSFKSIKGKIAHYLLQMDMKQQGSGVLRLDRTHDQLADLFGVARPSLSRAMRELHRLGVIDVKGKEVVINQREELKRWVGE